MEQVCRLTAENMTTSDLYINAAKDIVNALHLVLKNRGIYPVEHSICTRSTESFAQALYSFLSTHGNFKLEVSRECLSLGSEVVYQNQGEKRDLPFVLFRDGIQWIELQQGFEVTHLLQFIEVLDKYKDLPPEAEEDLVTALWEANLPNLRYKAVDVYWQAEPIVDISSLPVRCDENRPSTTSEPTPFDATAIMPQTDPHSLLQLTPDEMAQLKEMISKDESRDTNQDLMEVLSVLLNEQSRPDDLETVLTFLHEEVHDTLKSGELSFAVTLLEHLHQSRKTFEVEKPWAIPLIDTFFLNFTNPETLRVVADMWLSPKMADDHRLEVMGSFLLLLPPEALFSLGPVLPQIRIPKAQEHLMKLFEESAQKDITPLENLLSNSEPAVVERLVVILGRLKKERPKEILSELVHHHWIPVRRQALRQLLAQDPERIFDFFNMIEDTSEAIRQVILGSLGQVRNPPAEEKLLQYLENEAFKIDTDEHLLNCYRALGRCGSNRSVPFLDGQLFKHGWLSAPLKPVHRQGALIALSNIGTDEASDVLKKAAKSLKPGIRNAYRKIIEKK